MQIMLATLLIGNAEMLEEENCTECEELQNPQAVPIKKTQTP